MIGGITTYVRTENGSSGVREFSLENAGEAEMGKWLLERVRPGSEAPPQIRCDGGDGGAA